MAGQLPVAMAIEGMPRPLSAACSVAQSIDCRYIPPGCQCIVSVKRESRSSLTSHGMEEAMAADSAACVDHSTFPAQYGTLGSAQIETTGKHWAPGDTGEEFYMSWQLSIRVPQLLHLNCECLKRMCQRCRHLKPDCQ